MIYIQRCPESCVVSKTTTRQRKTRRVDHISIPDWVIGHIPELSSRLSSADLNFISCSPSAEGNQHE